MKKLFYYEAAYGEEWWAETEEDMPYGIDDELLVANFTGKDLTFGGVELPSDGTIDDIIEAYQNHHGVVNFFWKKEADEADLWIVPDEYLYLFKGTKFNVEGAKGNKLPTDLCIQDEGGCSWGERVELPKTEFFTTDAAESEEETDLPWMK